MRSREIRRILDAGRPARGERVIVFLAPGADRVAVIAGKRVGGAVERNRARRVLREAWRQVEIVGAKSQDLVSEMTELLEGAGRR